MSLDFLTFSNTSHCKINHLPAVSNLLAMCSGVGTAWGSQPSGGGEAAAGGGAGHADQPHTQTGESGSRENRPGVDWTWFSRVFSVSPLEVSLLQSQVQNSESLLQGLQKSFSQSQNAVQTRLVGDSVARTLLAGSKVFLPLNWSTFTCMCVCV